MCWFECIISLLDYHNYILAEEIRKVILPVQFQLSIGSIWCCNGVKVLVQLARLLTKSSPWDGVVITTVLLVNEYNLGHSYLPLASAIPRITFEELSLV